MGTITRRRGVRVGDSVHPHGRGDNRSCGINSGSVSGSPPRAWGQWRAVGAKPAGRRFTPTGVGTIATQPRQPAMQTVHPHGRGDNGAVGGAPDGASGSPPRAWGQYRHRNSHGKPRRFIPTGVGTMVVHVPLVSTRSVHPHGRGDNLLALLIPLEKNGSPPRAWGQWAG